MQCCQKRFLPPKKMKVGYLFKSSNATHFAQTKKLQFWSFEQITLLHQPNRIARRQNVSPTVQSLASTDGPPLPPFPAQGKGGGENALRPYCTHAGGGGEYINCT